MLKFSMENKLHERKNKNVVFLLNFSFSCITCSVIDKRATTDLQFNRQIWTKLK